MYRPLIALVILAATYLGLALGRVPGLRVDRTGVANVIVVEVARRERIEIGFVEYCRVGAPLTILTLLIGWLFLVTVPV